MRRRPAGPRQGALRGAKVVAGCDFTSEYAIEGAALCNPSMVAHPDQSGLAAAQLRFVMSVRGIGEGHLSSIGFRTGIDRRSRRRSFDPPRRSPPPARRSRSARAAVFRNELTRVDDAGEAADYVLDGIGERFTRPTLEERLTKSRDFNENPQAQRKQTIALIRCHRRAAPTPSNSPTALRFASGCCGRRCGPSARAWRTHVSSVSSTTTAPSLSTPPTRRTSGSHISQQLLETSDFRSFTSTADRRTAARNKGLALFPRRIGGRFAAHVEMRRESNIVTSCEICPSGRTRASLQSPTRAWEVLQVGNCGPPIETEHGWLVLTHGVGPMRTYCIGAMLLDLDDPDRMLASCRSHC